MIFKESKIAHQYLDGLPGLEIGASAHNPFGLNTLNVDLYTDGQHVKEQLKMCGKTAKVDIIANGDQIPVPDKSYDFVISSHVIEHFANPIKALEEWERIALKYIFMIVPHKQRTFDRNRPLTGIDEIIEAWANDLPNTEDKHHYTYTPENFTALLKYLGHDFTIIEPDDKVGNGFIAIIKLDGDES